MSNKVILTHIQGLRGVAILLVLLYHALPQWCPNGFWGVDVFFVISGYFLIGPYLYGKSDFHLPEFCRKKACRILPPYFVAVILTTLAAILILPAADFMPFFTMFKALLLGYPNQHLASLSQSYFATTTRENPFMHLWYMGVLMQCYILFGAIFLCFGFFKAGNKLRVALISLLGAASLYWALQPFSPDFRALYGSIYYLTFPRIWEFVLGGLLYGLPHATFQRWAGIISGITMAALVVGAFTPIHHGEIYTCCGAAAGAILVCFGNNGLCNRILGCRAILWVGAASFSLYLVHWPWICFSEYFLCTPLSPSMAALLIPVVLASGWAFYFFVERRKFAIWTLPVIMIICCGLFKLCLMTSGFHDYLHREANALDINEHHSWLFEFKYSAVDENSYLYANTEGITPNQSSPKEKLAELFQHVGDTSLPISFVVLGDSHAVDLSYGLDIAGQMHGWHGILVNSYVVPFWGMKVSVRGNRVAPGNFFDKKKGEALMEWLKQHDEIPMVLIANYWGNRVRPHRKWDGSYVKEDYERLCAEELREFCMLLKERGKTVVLATDTPELTIDNPLRLIRAKKAYNLASRVDPILLYNEEDYQKANRYINEVMDELQREGVCEVLHRETPFFARETPSAVCEGDPLFRDRHHLTFFGKYFSISTEIEHLKELLRRAE